jgi:pimeloyl-ACP methyl ester carboxylesterase
MPSLAGVTSAPSRRRGGPRARLARPHPPPTSARIRSGFPQDFPIAALNQAFNASQDKLTALVPEARHVIAAKSGHYIQLDQPRVVIDAIRSVVKEARGD